jgi:hypothetical protein
MIVLDRTHLKVYLDENKNMLSLYFVILISDFSWFADISHRLKFVYQEAKNAALCS